MAELLCNKSFSEKYLSFESLYLGLPCTRVRRFHSPAMLRPCSMSTSLPAEDRQARQRNGERVATTTTVLPLRLRVIITTVWSIRSPMFRFKDDIHGMLMLTSTSGTARRADFSRIRFFAIATSDISTDRPPKTTPCPYPSSRPSPCGRNFPLTSPVPRVVASIVQLQPVFRRPIRPTCTRSLVCTRQALVAQRQLTPRSGARIWSSQRQCTLTYLLVRILSRDSTPSLARGQC